MQWFISILRYSVGDALFQCHAVFPFEPVQTIFARDIVVLIRQHSRKHPWSERKERPLGKNAFSAEVSSFLAHED